MAWIESHQSLGRHPKTKAAARVLGISRVQLVGHLQYLWWWALDFAEDGDLSGIDPEDIAEEAMWEGDPDAFIAGLVQTGFLTETMHINDWDDYTGRLIAQRESNRQRQRRHREKRQQPEPAANTSPDRDSDVSSQPAPETRNGDVTVTSPLRHGSTVPNQTEPDQTEPENPAREARGGADAPASGKPRTARQEASDRRHERRLELFAAYCRGLELDPGSEDAQVYRDRAFRELKPVQDHPAPSPADMEACTRYLTAQPWRDEPPKIPQVLGSYAGWVAKGKPDQPEPNDRASPGSRHRSHDDLEAWRRKHGLAPGDASAIDVKGVAR